MATTKYEVTYIIKPDVDEESKQALVERYDNVLNQNGSEVVESKDWGKKNVLHTK